MGQISSSHFYGFTGLSFFGMLSLSVFCYVMHKICSKNDTCKSKHKCKECQTDIESQLKVDTKNAINELVGTLLTVKEKSESGGKQKIPVSTKDAEAQTMEEATQTRREIESVNEDNKRSEDSTKRTDANTIQCAFVSSKESTPPDKILKKLEPTQRGNSDDLNTTASMETETINKVSTEDCGAEVTKPDEEKETAIVIKSEEIEEPKSEEEEEAVILVFGMDTELSSNDSVVLNTESTDREINATIKEILDKPEKDLPYLNFSLEASYSTESIEELECSSNTEDKEFSETETEKNIFTSNDRKSMKKKSEKKHKCPSCEKSFKLECGVKAHLNSVHKFDSKENSVFSPSLTSTKTTLPLHLIDIDTENEGTSQQNLNLSRQKSYQKSQKSVLCPECDIRCKTRNGLKLHLERKHNIFVNNTFESDSE